MYVYKCYIYICVWYTITTIIRYTGTAAGGRGEL